MEQEMDQDQNRARCEGTEIQFEAGEGNCSECCLRPDRRSPEWNPRCLPCRASERGDGRDGIWIKTPPRA